MAKCAASGQPKVFPVSKQVYEVELMLWPQRGGPMRIIAFIDQATVVEKILTNLGLWLTHSHSPPESLAAWRHRGIPPEGWREFSSASSGPPDPLGRFGPGMSALRTLFGLTSSPRPWQPCAGFGPCPGLPRPRGRRCPPPREK